MTLERLPDLAGAASLGALSHRQLIARSSEGVAALPLLAGTESYARGWISQWHDSSIPRIAEDIACYLVADAIVSGDGQIWVQGHLVTDPTIMPAYVAHGLELSSGGCDRLHRDMTLPVRTIADPCLVAIGHGARVYGHFLIEMLFRILVAREAFRASDLRLRILLDQQSPGWLIKILTMHLGITENEIDFFRPEEERILLESAVIPTRVMQEDVVHPTANDMIEKLVEGLPISPLAGGSRRFFIRRNRFTNPAAPHRICVNEPQLAEIAARYGFLPLTLDGMSWLDQIALFRGAEIILGQAGSALHNALFCRPETRLASVGFMNLVQSQIGALRRQRLAYMTHGIELKGDFRVDEAKFATFIEAAVA